MLRRSPLLIPIALAAAACVRAPAPEGPIPANGAARSWAEKTLRRLTLREKVGQLVFARISAEYLAVGTPAYERLQGWVRDQGVGGVIITIGAPLEMASKLNLLQELAPLPLLVTADMEPGPRQSASATQLPPAMALGATGEERLAYEIARVTAREARATGVHWDYAPVVDVNNNPANPIINIRSYGEDPAAVARMSVAYVRGLQDHGMYATAKHFPGHGDTGTDSHIELPVITAAKERVDSVELVPYRAAIAAGVAAVMSAHIAFPALTGDSVPATLNPKLLTGLLREELGFDGIITTDAMDMGAIIRRYGSSQAAVMAVKAGADALLQPLPQDVPVMIDAVVAAVERGEIAPARLDRSVLRLLEAKARLGLHRRRTVDLSRIPHVIGSPEHLAVAREAAERSITVVRDRDRLLPLRADRKTLSVVYTDDYDPSAGVALHQALAPRLPGLRTVLVDARTPALALDSLLARADSFDLVLFSPFVRVRAYKGDVAVAEHVAAFLQQLIGRRPTIVTAFGNPYVLLQFPEVGTYVVAWGEADVSQVAAARALLGDIPVSGRLPISIPRYHPAGTGIRLDRATAGGATP